MLNSIAKIVKEFVKIIQMDRGARKAHFDERVGAKKRAKISFDSEEEIERIKNDNKFKQGQRNTLGVKTSESWIATLNIGNIMHLSPMDFDDMHIALLPDSLSKNSKNEYTRDMILEKIVYLTVAYFCVGTEYRFLNSKIDAKRYDK
jgi:hypothetical protein